jgi:hypothetical protein
MKPHDTLSSGSLSGDASLSALSNFPPLPPVEPHNKALDTASLLAQQAAHEKAKADHITALLQERDDLEKSTEERLEAIACDLKMLGYSKPRAPRTKKEKV